MPRRFGTKIRQLRHHHKLTLVELATRLALASHAHLANIELGRRSFSLEVALRAAHTFGVTTDYLRRDSIAPEDFLHHETPLPVQTDLPVQLGTKIRLLRTLRGVPQSVLAKQIGNATQAFLSNVEAGRKYPSPALIVPIADALTTSTDHLLHDGIAIES